MKNIELALAERCWYSAAANKRKLRRDHHDDGWIEQTGYALH